MARKERSAGFVLFHRGAAPDFRVEYLVLDYGRHWEFAKGHVKKGEDDLDAACRELVEETGITDVSVVEGFQREIVYFFRGRKHGMVRKTVVFFLGETRGRTVALSDEHVGFAFLAYEAAFERITFPSARQVLRDAKAHIESNGTSPHASGDTMP